MANKHLLPESDIAEVNWFREYLADMQTMAHEPFYRKYQEYMGLTDEELRIAIINRAAQ